MIQNKNEEAFNALRDLCGEDTGCFIFTNHKKAQAKYKAKINQANQVHTGEEPQSIEFN